jgi:hypothetical protein
MTTAKGLNGANAYTRESVEAYLRAVEAERVKLGEAIAVARARTERATAERQRLDGGTPAGADGLPASDGGSAETGAVGAMDTGPGIPSALAHSFDDDTLWLSPETAATVARD